MTSQIGPNCGINPSVLRRKIQTSLKQTPMAKNMTKAEMRKSSTALASERLGLISEAERKAIVGNLETAVANRFAEKIQRIQQNGEAIMPVWRSFKKPLRKLDCQG